MRTALYYLFLFSGILPAAILLVLTLIFVPNVLTNFEHNVESIAVIVSFLFGICGSVGLLKLINIRETRRYIPTGLLLTLGILGSVLFLTITGGSKALQWVISVEEPDEWLIFVWPNIVSLTFLIGFLLKGFGVRDKEKR